MTALLIASRNAHKVDEIRAILGEGLQRVAALSPQKPPSAQFDPSGEGGIGGRGPIHFLTLNDFPGAPNVVEDAPTFAGNATRKAVELARWISFSSPVTRHPSLKYVLADDSGLEVDALNGAPGVHSARFAALDSGGAGNSSDAENLAKLLRVLKDVPLEKRTARFRCVIALAPLICDKIESASPVCYADEFEMQTQLFDGACEGRIGFAPRGQGGFGYDPLFLPGGFQQTFAELGEKIKNRMSHRGLALAKLKDWFEKQM